MDRVADMGEEDMRTRRDLTKKEYLRGIQDAIGDIDDRREKLEEFFGHSPDGRCHWPKCKFRTTARLSSDGDAFFCSKHCPICNGWPE